MYQGDDSSCCVWGVGCMGGWGGVGWGGVCNMGVLQARVSLVEVVQQRWEGERRGLRGKRLAEHPGMLEADDSILCYCSYPFRPSHPTSSSRFGTPPLATVLPTVAAADAAPSYSPLGPARLPDANQYPHAFTSPATAAPHPMVPFPWLGQLLGQHGHQRLHHSAAARPHPLLSTHFLFACRHQRFRYSLTPYTVSSQFTRTPLPPTPSLYTRQCTAHAPSPPASAGPPAWPAAPPPLRCRRAPRCRTPRRTPRGAPGPDQRSRQRSGRLGEGGGKAGAGGVKVGGRRGV